MLKWNSLKVNIEIVWNKQPVIENVLGKKIIAFCYSHYERSFTKKSVKRYLENNAIGYWKKLCNIHFHCWSNIWNKIVAKKKFKIQAKVAKTCHKK